MLMTGAPSPKEELLHRPTSLLVPGVRVFFSVCLCIHTRMACLDVWGLVDSSGDS